jgi:hypothetical protein
MAATYARHQPPVIYDDVMGLLTSEDIVNQNVQPSVAVPLTLVLSLVIGATFSNTLNAQTPSAADTTETVTVESAAAGPRASRVRPLEIAERGNLASNPAASRMDKIAQGAVIGFASGALVGAALTAVYHESGNLTLNMVVFALPGAVVGALAGAVW